MGFGIKTTRLWRLRYLVAACAVLALAASVWSVWRVDLRHQRKPRALDMATAWTSMMVDNPKPTLLDLTQDTYSLEALSDRAVVLGTVMANGPLREAIARRAGVPAHVLRVDAPLTPIQPRVPVERGKEKKTSDILRSTDQYRLHLEVDPTVPVLDVYSQAPSARMAEQLADAAVAAAREYIDQLGVAEGTPERYRIHVRQLGRAHGEVINPGVRWQVAFLAFSLTFGLGCAVLITLSWIGDGWRMARLADKPADAREGARGMELVSILRVLWAHKLLVIAGLVLAVTAGLKLGGGTTAPSGYAWTRVLVDTRTSALVKPAPFGADTLPWRAGLLADLLASEDVKRQIARGAQIPVEQLAIVDHSLANPTVDASEPKAAAEAAAITSSPTWRRSTPTSRCRSSRSRRSPRTGDRRAGSRVGRDRARGAGSLRARSQAAGLRDRAFRRGAPAPSPASQTPRRGSARRSCCSPSGAGSSRSCPESRACGA